MPLSVRHKLNRLPKRFPVGTTFVVEGRTIGADGENSRELQVFSRFVVLPGGRRIELGGDPAGTARKRRSTGGARSGQPTRRSSGPKKNAKKIMTTAGTTLRSCR
jgi:hypothetical protein